MQLILIHVFAICFVRALETPVPASFLQPRNFNPHPYQDDDRTPEQFIIVPGYHQDDFRRINLEQKFQEFSRKTQSTGPIQFPANPDDQLQQQQQQQQQQSNSIAHIVDIQSLTPQSFKTLHHRNGGFLDNQSPQIISRFENRPRRVQSKKLHRKFYIQPEEHDSYEPALLEQQPKHYVFSYSVKGDKSGDDFSHTQKQENGAVQGSYKVNLPDGRIQIVKYTADDVHGYRADVSYDVGQTAPTPQLIESTRKSFYPEKNIRYTATPTPHFNRNHNIQAPSYNFYPASAIPKYY